MRPSQSILLAAGVLFLYASTAFPQAVQWFPDSNAGFELTINGSGASYSDTVTSTSGLWSVSTFFTINFNSQPGYNEFEGGGVQITYLPTGGKMFMTGYAQPFPTNSSVYSQNNTPMRIDIPDTWSANANFAWIPQSVWHIDIRASGPELLIPEPSSLLLTMLGVLMLWAIRKRRAS